MAHGGGDWLVKQAVSTLCELCARASLTFDESSFPSHPWGRKLVMANGVSWGFLDSEGQLCPLPFMDIYSFLSV